MAASLTRSLPPGEFIAVAEDTGLIVALDRWVGREACRQGREWLDAGVAPMTIAVNVSGAQFKRAPALEADVAFVLASSGFPAGLLELELTETFVMEATGEANEVLVRLRQSGVKLAIDDFGTGFSSLDYLRRHPVDRVKIAQDFVRQITIDAGSAAIVRATIGLVRELGTKSIAEGVETAEQFELLKAWGCSEMQGFYFARPLSAKDILPLLRRGKSLGHGRKQQPRPDDSGAPAGWRRQAGLEAETDQRSYRLVLTGRPPDKASEARRDSAGGLSRLPLLAHSGHGSDADRLPQMSLKRTVTCPCSMYLGGDYAATGWPQPRWAGSADSAGVEGVFDSLVSDFFSPQCGLAKVDVNRLPAIQRGDVGALDYDTTAKDLLSVVKTKKTELLFMALFLKLLKPGGRAAVIVPDGVLFGSSGRPRRRGWSTPLMR